MSQIMKDEILNQTPKRKRGRPKGSKNKPKALPNKPEDIQKEKLVGGLQPEMSKKEVDKITDEMMTQSEQPFEGNPARTDAATHPGQADHLPGIRKRDKTYLPKRAYDSEINLDRQVTLPNEYHYCWVYPDLIASFKDKGYRQCKYKGGQLSGLAERGFKGTDMFEQTLDGNVRNGDIILMYIPIRGWEDLKAEEQKFINARNVAHSTQMHDEAYRHGIRSFEEQDGREVHN